MKMISLLFTTAAIDSHSTPPSPFNCSPLDAVRFQKCRGFCPFSARCLCIFFAMAFPIFPSPVHSQHCEVQLILLRTYQSILTAGFSGLPFSLLQLNWLDDYIDCVQFVQRICLCSEGQNKITSGWRDAFPAMYAHAAFLDCHNFPVRACIVTIVSHTTIPTAPKLASWWSWKGQCAMRQEATSIKVCLLSQGDGSVLISVRSVKSYVAQNLFSVLSRMWRALHFCSPTSEFCPCALHVDGILILAFSPRISAMLINAPYGINYGGFLP